MSPPPPPPPPPPPTANTVIPKPPSLIDSEPKAKPRQKTETSSGPVNGIGGLFAGGVPSKPSEARKSKVLPANFDVSQIPPPNDTSPQPPVTSQSVKPKNGSTPNASSSLSSSSSSHVPPPPPPAITNNHVPPPPPPAVATGNSHVPPPPPPVAITNNHVPPPPVNSSSDSVHTNNNTNSNNSLQSPPESLPVSQTQDDSWLDKFSKKNSSASASESDYIISKYGTYSAGTFEQIKKRALKNSKSSFSTLKRKSGKSLAINVKGTIFDLSKNLFTDFPEIQFKDFPLSCVSEQDKKQQKELETLIDQLAKTREKLIADRNLSFKQQQKREEELIKEYQIEKNERGKIELKEFEKRLKQTKKERKGTASPMTDEEEKMKSKEFEEKMSKQLEEEQEEFEKRLVTQRTKWILPWIMHMKTSELVQYAQIHSLEMIHLEQIQRVERKKVDEEFDVLSKEELENKEKELKETAKERKKTSRPMSKDEIQWERDLHQKGQDEKYLYKKKDLSINQKKRQEKLEDDQQKQLENLFKHYEEIERLVFTS